MVKVIELPESLREVCSEREIWIPKSECQTIVRNEEPQPVEEDRPRLQKKLDLGTPL